MRSNKYYTSFILINFFWNLNFIYGQSLFLYQTTNPYSNHFSDALIENNLTYFIDTYFTDNNNPAATIHSSILIYSGYKIVDSIPIGLIGFQCQRIIFKNGPSFYLLGILRSDSCLSSVTLSEFNIETNQLTHISSYPFCNENVENLKLIKGLNENVFVEGYHVTNPDVGKFLLRIDENLQLTSANTDIEFHQFLSVDFKRTGYVLKNFAFCDFYTSEFEFINTKYKNIEGFYSVHQTHKPFGAHYIIEQVLKSMSYPDAGQHIRIVDSNLTQVHQVVITPGFGNTALMDLPFFGGLEINTDNEIWSAAMYGYEPFMHPDSTFFSVSKLDSTLNIICQHFLGYDTYYRLFGLYLTNEDHLLIYGSKLRPGTNLNSGEDAFAMFLGPSCELPTVSTNEHECPLISISAYPNPGINELSFSIHGFDPTTLHVEMIDVLGQVLFTASDLSSSIEVVDFPSGQYFYRILQKDRLLGVGSWVKQ